MISINQLNELAGHNRDHSILLRAYKRACLRYLSARSEHIYRKLSAQPTELTAKADENRTRAHDNLIACYNALFRNLNKNIDNPLPVFTSRKEIGLVGIQHGLELLKSSG